MTPKPLTKEDIDYMIAANTMMPPNIIPLEESPKKSLVVCKIEVAESDYRQVDRVVSVTVPEWLFDGSMDKHRMRTFVVSLNDKKALVEALCSILEKL